MDDIIADHRTDRNHRRPHTPCSSSMRRGLHSLTDRRTETLPTTDRNPFRVTLTVYSPSEIRPKRKRPWRLLTARLIFSVVPGPRISTSTPSSGFLSASECTLPSTLRMVGFPPIVQ